MSAYQANESAKTAHTLPVAIEQRSERPSMARYVLLASFVSHLIAERDRMAPQRLRQRTNAATATSAYRTGATISVKRMPSGFRHTSTI